MSTWETRTPRPKPPNSVGRSGLTNLLTTGIVNPMGPTLNVLALDGTPDEGATRSVVHLMLHPFYPQAWRVGTCRDLSTDDLAAGLKTFFRHLQQDAGCPTLLIPTTLIDEADAITLHADFLEGFGNGSETAARVRRYPGDPWKRVESEIEQTGTREMDAGAMTKDAALSFARTQLAPDNVKAELEAFLFAWRGSINFQAELGSSLAKSAMSIDELTHYLALLASTSRIPGITA